MSPSSIAIWAVPCSVVLLVLYIYTNNRKISHLPDNYEAFTTKLRCTPEEVLETAARLAQGKPLTVDNQLPPKTGRRYIIVGGVCSFMIL